MATIVENMCSFCLILALFLTVSCDDKVTDPDQTPALNPEEMYRDMFPLVRKNFTEKVLRNKDPWIIIFHDGSMDRAWKTMATHLRGLCWIGMIDTREEEAFLKEIEYDKDKDTGSRVYPYGDRRKKETNWGRAKTQNEARSLAVSSLPDKTLRLTGNGVESFLLACFQAQPSKFPVYLITEEEETPVLWKALAIRFEKYFSFARIYKPDSDDLKALGLEEYFIAPPALFVLVMQDENLENINAIHFDTAKQGLLNYTNVMAFFFVINSEYRYKLPGENQSNQKTEAEMKDVIQIESQRFEIQVQGRNRSSKEPTKATLDKENIEFKTPEETTFLSDKDEL